MHDLEGQWIPPVPYEHSYSFLLHYVFISSVSTVPVRFGVSFRLVAPVSFLRICSPVNGDPSSEPVPAHTAPCVGSAYVV